MAVAGEAFSKSGFPPREMVASKLKHEAQPSCPRSPTPTDRPRITRDQVWRFKKIPLGPND